MSGETAAILSGAADAIERDGWCTRAMHTPAGSHCASGAMAVAAGYHVMYQDGRLHGQRMGGRFAWVQANRALTEFLGLPAGAVPAWNDSQESSWPVVEALRTCAEKVAAS